MAKLASIMSYKGNFTCEEKTTLRKFPSISGNCFARRMTRLASIMYYKDIFTYGKNIAEKFSCVKVAFIMSYKTIARKFSSVSGNCSARGMAKLASIMSCKGNFIYGKSHMLEIFPESVEIVQQEEWQS